MSKHYIVVLDAEAKVGGFLSVEGETVLLEVIAASFENPLKTFLAGIEGKKISMGVAETDLETGDSWVGTRDVAAGEEDYLIALHDELKREGFTVRMISDSLKDVVLSVNAATFSREERDVFWTEVTAVTEEEAQIWEQLKENKDASTASQNA